MLRRTALGGKWQRRVLSVTPPDTARKPAMGAATTNDSTFNSLQTNVGTMDVRRSYNSGFTSNFMNTNAASDVAANRWSVYSFKLSPSGVASGSSDAALTSFISTIPAGHKTTLVMWHEPEDNIKNGEFTLADWQNAQVRLADLIHATNRPELSHAICLMEYTFLPASGRRPNDYWPASFNGKVNYVGIDAYNTYKFLGGTKWEDWSVTQARFNPWIEAKGVPSILMEYASAEDENQATRKPGWMNDVYVWAQNHNCAALCYFDIVGVGMVESHLLDSSTQTTNEFRDEVADSKL